MATLKDIRSQFPILEREVRGYPLVYLDNGASTQRPQVVIDAIDTYYKEYHSNVHRGVHYLSSLATEKMEEARRKIQKFLNAPTEQEIIFTSGVTQAINTIARGLEGVVLKKGDEILISTIEHHANIVPWQMLCERIGTVLKVVPIKDSGDLDMEAFQGLISEKTALVSMVHVSNTLGTINPVEDIIAKAKDVGALTLIDGAQAVAHMPIDVQALDCDFYCFSGHKIFGPTGSGAFYGRAEILRRMSPMIGGGEMIEKVTFEKTTYADIPFKFEAGTPNIAGNIGLGVAIDFVSALDWKEVARHEKELLEKTIEGLQAIDGVRLIGMPAHRSGVVSFIVEDMHPADFGWILDGHGVAVRTGNHCTEPLMAHLGLEGGTIRASFSLYNTLDDVDRLIAAVKKALSMLR